MSDEETAEARYKIVIGVDFEATGDDALSDALRIAREHPNDELHAVHVVKLTGESHSAQELDRVADQMGACEGKLRERVHTVCERLFPGEEWEQAVVFHVRVGSPATAIHQVAVDYDADLIVVGTHARTGLKKMLLGSVADELVKTAHMPVLVARPKEIEELPRSSRADERREGEDLTSGSSTRETVRFGRRGGHIAGLI